MSVIIPDERYDLSVDRLRSLPSHAVR